MSSDHKKTHIPIKRGLYAFLVQRKGEFILFIEEDEDIYRFMQLPDRFEFCLTKKDFEKAIVKNTLDFIEAIPEEVFEVSIANMIKKN